MKNRCAYLIPAVICIILVGFLIAPLTHAEQTGPAIAEDGYECTVQPLSCADRHYALIAGLYEKETGPDAHVRHTPDAFEDAEAHVVPGDPERAAKPDTELVMIMDFKAEEDRKTVVSEETEAVEEADIADPLEPVNRAFFVFNDKLYFWVLKPAANAYSFFVPEWGRTRVRNVFDNIKAPIRIVNALLQLKMHKFAMEFSSFVLNSTVGIAGMFDIAARHPELDTSREDLGQTFGSYGIGEGFYLVLPILGPSSLRDTVGLAGDSFLDPVSYISPFRDEVAVRAFDQVSETSFRIGDYEDIKESALDPYISVKDIYKQYRRNKVRE
jgi:phospholipid-binding lipoprotein MlaA